MAMTVYWKARLLFVTALLAGAAIVAAWYAWSSSRSRIYQITTHDPVHGLIVNAPVEFHGVEVGKVATIELIGPDTASIHLSIDNDVPVSGATVATITSRGLAPRGFAGYVYIALENHGGGSERLLPGAGAQYPTIASAPSQIETMDSTAAMAIAKVDEITRLLEMALDEKNVASLKRSIEGLLQVTDRLAAVLDEKNVASLERSLDNLDRITTTLAANNERIEALLSNAERDTREIRPLIEAGSGTVRALNTQTLPQLYRSMSELERLTRTLGGVATALARDPSVLLRGTSTPPGPGER